MKYESSSWILMPNILKKLLIYNLHTNFSHLSVNRMKMKAISVLLNSLEFSLHYFKWKLSLILWLLLFVCCSQLLLAQQPCQDVPTIWVFDEDQGADNYHLWSFSDYNNANATGIDFGRARYFDPITNVITNFPTSGNPGDIESMAVDPTTGIVYLTSADRLPGGPSGTQALWAADLDTVNVTNGVVFKLVGHIDAQGDNASENLAYNNGRLYFAQTNGTALNTDTNTDGLSYITISGLNPNPMLATNAIPVGLLTGAGADIYYLDGLEILPDGTTYGVDGYDDQLYTINLSTGAILTVSDNNLNGGLSGSVDIETVVWDPVNSKLIGADNGVQRFVDVTPGTNGGNLVTSVYIPGTPGLPTDADFEGSAMYVMCSQPLVCDYSIDTICNDGTQSITFTADVGISNVVWRDSTSNSIIGTGPVLTINGTESYLADGFEAIYYTGTDASGCPGELCCKVYVATKNCCAISATITPGTCNDNGTPYDYSDDYFVVTVNSSNTGAGSSNSFEVVLGGVVIGTGTYGTPLNVGNATTPPFKPDGSTTYSLTVRDADFNDCITQTIVVGPVQPCPRYYDWGDLPDTNTTGSYPTNTANGGEGVGPSHEIISGIKIGSTIDSESNGQPNSTATGDGADEDGVTMPMLVAGEAATISVNVMNMTGQDAKLTMFIDYNKNGILNDPGEMYSAIVPTGTNGAINIPIVVPSTAVLNMDLGVRFRLSTDMTASMLPTGPAPDGEVEDYMVSIMGYDYGDLADSALGTGSSNYETLDANNGPNHKIISTLKIGTLEDAEADGNPSAIANGDDASGTDDEDGVTIPMLVAGSSATIPVVVMNMTGSDAKLTMFIDYNGDGDFDDAGEMSSTTVPTGTNGTVNLTTLVPINAITNTNFGVRFRLSTDFAASMSPTGSAPDGEVEDYISQVMAFDYGDLADSGAGTGSLNYETQAANNGPAHKIISGLKIGATVDPEIDGNQSALATGDDSSNTGSVDDEDGATLPMFIAGETATIPVVVMNMTGSDAKLTMFMDFNNDGDFNDLGEMTSTTVPTGTNGSVNLTLAVPDNAVINTNLGVRFRLSNDFTSAMSATGVSSSGEVEDYMASVMGFDRGDLADTGAGTSSNNYQTTNADSGPSHKIISGLKMGLSVDPEADGSPSVNADGDDFSGVTPDDEDGVILPAFVTGNTVSVPVVVMNMTGITAKLTMFVDFNNDGDLVDAGEMASINVPSGTNTTMLVPIAVPINAVPNTPLGVRFRLSTDAAASMSPIGAAPDGEVEDYLVRITGPDITHNKSIVSVTQTSANNYSVVYQIEVTNSSLGIGSYGLDDVPNFDDDITILSSNYSSTAPGNPGGVLAGSGPWTLATNQTIAGNTTHVYTLTVDVNINLAATSGGDNNYTACGETTTGNPISGEGLFNESVLDIFDDGTVDERDTACADLPYIIHDKTFVNAVQTSPNTWNVTYHIDVQNLGGATGQYNLRDEPVFENDITINNVSYTSTAPGNPGLGLPTTPPWNLAGDQLINAGITHQYTLTVNLTLNLQDQVTGDNQYTECGTSVPGIPNPGEGLFNRSLLDVNDDGVPDQRDSVCADLPYLIQDKTVSSLTQIGGNSYRIVYQVQVNNLGGATGTYNLQDVPVFDNDVTILAANYSTDASGNTGNPGPSILAGSGPWTLATDQSIAAGGVQLYTLTVDVSISLQAGSGGDDVYTACGSLNPGVPSAGEGLFNRSLMDVNDDGVADQKDSVCADIPAIVHEKSIVSTVQTGARTFDVTYKITVTNQGGASGSYSLSDQPVFDSDIVITGANFTSDVPTIPGGTLIGSGPWTLASNQVITAGDIDMYLIVVHTSIDLQNAGPGDNVYTECGSSNPSNPQPNEGLFNESRLDLNNDGTPDQRDSVCADLPYVIHNKTVASITDLGNHQFQVVYYIDVQNIGGATGQYDLNDIPGFENDFQVLSASYVSNAPGHPANPSSIALSLGGPWNLADDQSILASASHRYTVTVLTTIDLVDSPSAGDEIYNHCGTANPGTPQAGEGLFNRTTLDVNNDGVPDDRDTVCADVSIWDLALRKKTITAGPYSYGQPIVFEITVFNQGNETATNVVVNDYVPSGYTFLANNGWTGVAPAISNTITSSIAPRDSAKLTLVLTLAMTNGGVNNWINYSEIASSQDLVGNDRTNDDIDSDAGSDGPGERAVTPGSTADNNITSQDKGGEEDDHDPAGLPVYDLALIKKPAGTGPYSYGDLVPFNIWIYNQGNITADEIQVVDYIPTGFEFNNASNTPTWTYNSVTRKANMTWTSPILPGDSSMLTIYLNIVPSTGGRLNWVNYAEIFGSQDGNGNNMNDGDIDSRPNTNLNDDPGGQPLTSDDDNKSGDGKAGQDEDDHDPALIEVIDLALRKTLTTSEPYSYGQVHNFRIVVYNQGNEYMEDVVVTDHVPTGYSFNSGSNPGWSGAAPSVNYTIAGPLAPGDSAVVNLLLTLEMTDGGLTNWLNYAEITSMKDTTGADRTLDDIDSNPGSDSPEERDVIPGSPNDDNITSTDKGGEEDDHDPAGPKIFDLAQIKQTVTAGPYRYGDLVEYKITAYNQGNQTAYAISTVDYIPCGLEFENTAVNFGWTYDASTNMARTTMAFVINPGDSAVKSIFLRVKPCYTGEANAWTNYAEIKSILDGTGTVVTDIDSNPDMNPNDDPGGDPDTPDDDNKDGDGKAGEDEDDHDPSRIEVIDLALRKVLQTAGPYHYGDLLTFGITVKNQGNVPMDEVNIQDYIPTGYSYNSGDNPLWLGSYPTVNYWYTARLNPGDSVTIPLKLRIIMTPGAEKAYINYAEIEQIVDSTGTNRNTDDADSNPGSDGPDERAVEPGDPADDDITSIDRGGEEDDHDPGGIEVFDLAQKKWTTQTGPFKYGDDVTFNIRVYNQGSIAANTISIVDYIPCGYEFIGANNPTWTFDSGSSNASTVIAGPVVPGDSVTITLTLRVKACYSNVSTAWTNYTEISGAKDPDGNPGDDIDSDSDTNPSNDPGGEPDSPNDDKTNGDGSKGEDEDDHDPARIEVYDLALRKYMITPAPYSYGQTLTFGVTVYNQGNVPAENVTVVDRIPEGYSFSANNGWTGAYPTITRNISNRINPGDSVVLVLDLTLESVTSSTYRSWINFAEVSEGRDSNNVIRVDADSDPNSNTPNEQGVTPNSPGDDNITSNSDTGVGSQDDHDPAGPQIVDLALRKKYTGTLPITYGNIVPFTISIFNQGNVSSINTQVVDYVPTGYEFVAANNANWTYDVVSRKATTNYAPKIIPGDSGAVTIYLKVVPQLGNQNAWYNLAEIKTFTDSTNTPRVDIDSHPDTDPGNDGEPKDDEIDDPNDQDDHDPATPPIVDLALRKWVPNEKLFYLPGETVNFKITVFNQGNVPAASIGLRDYLPNGFSFNAANNPGWTLIGSNLEYTHTGLLNPTDSVQISLNLEVIIPASNVSIYSWENYAEVRSMTDTSGVDRTNDDADSDPASDSPREREVHDGDPWDNVIDGNGTTDSGNEDEDDHDPDRVTVTAYLGDYVWDDLDGDGVQDPNEPGIQGVVVYLHDCRDGSIVKKDTTDANGIYGFEGLFAGDYFVRFDYSKTPYFSNYGWTFKNKGGDDAKDSDVNASGVTECTHLDWGERDSTIDAGLVQLAKYGDYVWHDRNANGMQDAGEEGIGQILVYLYDAETNLPVRNTMTDNNGYYLFEKLMPMRYYAKYVVPGGWNVTDPNLGPDFKDSDVDGSNGSGTNATTYLSPGEDDRTWDLGLWKCACITGDVWYDLNKDGIYQRDDENGIAGLSVIIYDAMTNQIAGKTITGINPNQFSDDGYYPCLCLKPGMYYVQFERPGNLAAGPALAGTDPNIDSDITHDYGVNTTRKLTVLSGDHIPNVGAGFQNKATVGNFVWLDANLNGIQDSGEKPVAGVTVSAYKVSGAIVSQSTTDNSGQYTLDGIAQGDYYVKFAPPSQYGFTRAHQGVDAMDSDVDGTNGKGTTEVMRVLTDQNLTNVDAGLILQVLPLEWLSFEGRYNGAFTELDWSTGVELNNSHFEIERRYESEKEFMVIGREDASSQSELSLHNYTYDDYNVSQAGIYYYRIKQVDLDGSSNYSKVISVRLTQNNVFEVFIYPNPVNDRLRVDLQIGEESNVEVKVYDQNGKQVLYNPFGGRMKAGRYTETINTDLLVPGNYVLMIESAQGVINKKFVVAR